MHDHRNQEVVDNSVNAKALRPFGCYPKEQHSTIRDDGLTSEAPISHAIQVCFGGVLRTDDGQQ